MGIAADMWAVQKGQSLGSDSRAWPAADADQWLGLIEELHHRHQLAPLHHEVDAPPRVSLVKSARAVQRAVEHAADGQHAVTDRLRFKPLRRAPPKPKIL